MGVVVPTVRVLRMSEFTLDPDLALGVIESVDCCVDRCS